MLSSKRLYFILTFILGGLCCFAHYWSRSLGLIGSSESTLWELMWAFQTGAYSMEELFIKGHLFFVNIASIYKMFSFDFSVLGPFYLSFFFLMLYLSYQVRFLKEKKEMFFTLLIFINPFIFSLICNRPILVFVSLISVIIVKELQKERTKVLPRSILVISSLMGLLLLLGPMGVSSALSFAFIIPMARREMFQRHFSSSFFLFFFPLLAALVSVFYLSWLGQSSISEVLSLSFTEGQNIELIWPSIFPTLFVLITGSSLFYLVPVISYIIGIFLNFPTSFEGHLGLFLFLILLGLFQEKDKATRKNLLKAGGAFIGALVMMSFFSFPEMNTFYQTLFTGKKTQESVELHELADWTLGQVKRRTMIISSNQAKVGQFLKKGTPIDWSYNDSTERIILEKAFIARESSFPKRRGLQVVFENSFWRVLEKNPGNLLRSSKFQGFSSLLWDSLGRELLVFTFYFSFIVLLVEVRNSNYWRKEQ